MGLIRTLQHEIKGSMITQRLEQKQKIEEVMKEVTCVNAKVDKLQQEMTSKMDKILGHFSS